jgi:hypothetical protein
LISKTRFEFPGSNEEEDEAFGFVEEKSRTEVVEGKTSVLFSDIVWSIVINLINMKSTQMLC